MLNLLIQLSTAMSPFVLQKTSFALCCHQSSFNVLLIFSLESLNMFSSIFFCWSQGLIIFYSHLFWTPMLFILGLRPTSGILIKAGRSYHFTYQLPVCHGKLKTIVKPTKFTPLCLLYLPYTPTQTMSVIKYTTKSLCWLNNFCGYHWVLHICSLQIRTFSLLVF